MIYIGLLIGGRHKAMRDRPRAHSEPNLTASAGLLLPQQRRPKRHAALARTAAVILAKRNTPFSSSQINALQTGVRARRLSSRDSAPHRQQELGHQPRRATSNPPARRLIIPCSGEKFPVRATRIPCSVTLGNWPATPSNRWVIWRPSAPKRPEICKIPC